MAACASASTAPTGSELRPTNSSRLAHISPGSTGTRAGLPPPGPEITGIHARQWVNCVSSTRSADLPRGRANRVIPVCCSLNAGAPLQNLRPGQAQKQTEGPTPPISPAHIVPPVRVKPPPRRWRGRGGVAAGALSIQTDRAPLSPGPTRTRAFQGINSPCRTSLPAHRAPSGGLPSPWRWQPRHSVQAVDRCSENPGRRLPSTRPSPCRPRPSRR